ncbi:AAA family ATPase [Alkalihalophilus marmarensis]|uniref:AAA family ATPase n=1 Tax=Alkalihalophilus marmarensis TaxID=521377 RepID=UPI002E235850|nr:AAA family ATPase [Alkalihalophilus marmarensis]MED1603347.1 AAA family ATPase [Alkalihalophilus marmarensis]
MMWKKWSRIILPELQLLDFKRNTKENEAHMRVSGTHTTHTPSGLEAMKPSPSPHNRESNRPVSTTKPVKEKSSRKRLYKEEIDQLFHLVETSVGQRVYGQEEYLKELVLWFKKQYLLEGSLDGKAQVISVTGPIGTGKTEGLTEVVKTLHHHKLLTNQQVITLDVSLYSEKDIHSNFVKDFSSAFSYGGSTIVFKGINQAHTQVLTNLEQLVKNGYFRTEAGVMIDAAHHRLVFIAEKERDLPETIRTHITDHLHTKPLELEHLIKIAAQMLQRAQSQITELTNKQITYDDAVAELLAELSLQAEENSRVLKKWITVQLVESLVAARARGQLDNQARLITAEHAIYIEGQAQPLLTLEKAEAASVEQAFNELESLIGLAEVKTFVHELTKTVELQMKRKERGLSTTPLTLHMIFSGNPGTGKTTVARLISYILKGLGILSKGQLVEVARQDLVGEYVGHTGPKTMSKIQEALGGVLFIDEAYALSRNQHDSFGQEAIDTLVKGMEDHREDLVVILAGYTQEMEGFLKTNPGLRSRFPFQVEFSDYQADELYTMLELMAQKRDYQLDQESKKPLIELFERKQIPGRNDSGNGRLVRNVLEEAIRKQSVRVNEEEAADYQLLTVEDFGITDTHNFDLEEELSAYVGLDSVKNVIRTLEKQLLANKRRKEAGHTIRTEQVLNMVFSGNPGTGKTTIARTLSRMMKELGVLKKGHLVEVGRSELVSGYAGQTAEKTKSVVESALGGVLFIDEAYALVDGHGGYGEEAINEIVRLMEIHKDNLIVILAGYEDDMKKLLDTNAGLYSRFPLHIHFPDYTATELVQMLHILTKHRGFLLSHELDAVLEEAFRKKQAADREAAGNGRMVRNELEAAIRRQSVRIAEIDSNEPEALIELQAEDFDIHAETENKDQAKEQLNDIIGLQNVKTFMENLFAQVAMNERRKALNLPEISGQSLHMSFTGNPGTGKTTIARIAAKRLHELGVIATDRLIETDRSGLVAGYVGQTALKTKQIIDEARGGVLFIDEAYSLAGDQFGQEAIDTIVKAMEDLKGELVVIVAGYEKEMTEFWKSNSGLRSRFPHQIAFPDYSTDELVKIANVMFTHKGYKIEAGALEAIREQCEMETAKASGGNGRFVRNLMEATIRKHSVRLMDVPDAELEELITITKEDVSRREEIA